SSRRPAGAPTGLRDALAPVPDWRNVEPTPTAAPARVGRQTPRPDRGGRLRLRLPVLRPAAGVAPGTRHSRRRRLRRQLLQGAVPAAQSRLRGTAAETGGAVRGGQVAGRPPDRHARPAGALRLHRGGPLRAPSAADAPALPGSPRRAAGGLAYPSWRCDGPGWGRGRPSPGRLAAAGLGRRGALSRGGDAWGGGA